MEPSEHDLLEQIADQVHESWSGWMRYLFSLCQYRPGGSMTIPAERVSRALRQMDTRYADLSEQEKESDRIEARKILAVIESAKEQV